MNVRAAFSFVRDILFFYRTYHLSASTLDDVQMSDEPQLRNFTLSMISSRLKYDTLISEGYDFKPWHYKFTRRLSKGAIAQCIFVEKELVYMSWIAINREGQKSLGEPPVKVNFTDNETITGDFWTRPKYRGYGLAPYASGKRREFLKELGKTISKGAIRKDNVSSLKVREKRTTKGNTRIYAEGRHLNIMGCKFWTETPVNN